MNLEKLFAVSLGQQRVPWWLSGKESACSAGDLGLIPGLGRSPGEGNGNPLQYSCLENSMDREPVGLQSMGPKASDMTEKLTLSLSRDQ